MLNLFKKVYYLWEDYGFEIYIGFIIIIIFILSLFRIGKKGTWTSKQYLRYFLNTEKNNVIRKIPTESKGELECRRVLQKIFSLPFNKIRPNWLNNVVTGGNYNLELDCYNDKLKLACEYQGKQHYVYTPHFHKNKEAFLNQKYRDQMKRTLCRDNGVKLIEVPYTVNIKDIELYIYKSLDLI